VRVARSYIPGSVAPGEPPELFIGLRLSVARRLCNPCQRTPNCDSQSSCVRPKICLERATAFSLLLLLKKEGEGRGEEEALFINFPSLRLSPRSFLAGRERQNAAGVLRA
jgi:hypothetical protein